MVRIASQGAAPHMATPRSAYVHVPFCAHRCGYCDFALVANRRDLIPKYLKAIELELSRLGGEFELDTLFLGGGTPTQLGVDGLGRLAELLFQHFVLVDNAEFTVEANPNDMDDGMAIAMAELGVNRVSMGVQSFHKTKLLALDRQHTVDEASRAIQIASSFAQVGVDLIFAAPSESYQEWQDDLSIALQHNPAHLSTYGLTYESGTAFFSALRRGEKTEVLEEQQRKMFEWTIDEMLGYGFEHYEVSNFAQPGKRSRHNQVYWTGRPYFGLGPSAVSWREGVRRKNLSSTSKFLSITCAGQVAVDEIELPTAEEFARERLVFGLRRMEGVKREQFSFETGFEIEHLGGPALQRFIQNGWLEWKDDSLLLTREGLLISDSLWPSLI